MAKDAWFDRAAMLALLLGAVVVLADAGVLSLLAWTERCVPISRYPALFVGYFLTWLGVRAAAGPRTRRAVLLAGSLVCAAIFDAAFLVLSLIWIAALHRILFGASRRRVAHALAFVLASYAALAVACNRDLWPGFIAAHGEVARWGYLFAIAYTFRIAWLLHQVHVQRTPRMPLADVVTYFVFAPFFVIVPYMLAIPRCDQFRAGLDRHDPAIERSGLRMIAWGIALGVGAALLAQVYDPRQAAYAAARAHDYAAALRHAVIWYPGIAILDGATTAAILIGMVRVLGIDLGPSFNRPLLSRSVTEWWQRWNTHFRDLLVAIFYYPVVLRHRRTPVRATVLGCAAVFLVGSVLFHWPKTYFRAGSFAAFPAGTAAESAVMFVIVAIALVREQRRRLAPRPHPITGALTTWALVFLAVIAVGYGVQDLWNHHVGAPAPEPYPIRSHDVFPYF